MNMQIKACKDRFLINFLLRTALLKKRERCREGKQCWTRLAKCQKKTARERRAALCSKKPLVRYLRIARSPMNHMSLGDSHLAGRNVLWCYCVARILRIAPRPMRRAFTPIRALTACQIVLIVCSIIFFQLWNIVAKSDFVEIQNIIPIPRPHDLVESVQDFVQLLYKSLYHRARLEPHDLQLDRILLGNLPIDRWQRRREGYD